MRRVVALVGALALAGLLLFIVLGRGFGSAAPADAQAAGGAPTAGDGFEPVLGMPANNVVVLGSSPLEAPGEVWAYGTVGDAPSTVDGVPYADQLVLLEGTEASGWQTVPLPPASGGGPLSPATIGGALPEGLGGLGGRVTATGGVVLLTDGGIVVRDPGGAPRLVVSPDVGSSQAQPEHKRVDSHQASSVAGGSETEAPSEPLLKGESLPPAAPPSGANTPYAAIEEVNGHTGVLIAPYDDGAEAEPAAGGTGTGSGLGILHYDGEKWTRETIVWTGAKEEELTPQALACGGTQTSEDASSPENCWLLASYRVGATNKSNRLALFRRVLSKSEPSVYTWEREPVADWLLGEQSPPPAVTGSPSVMPLGPRAQTLTVTSQGVWIDFQAKLDGSSNPTDFSELVGIPGSEGADASVSGTWCYPTIEKVCERTLGASLPAAYRSFASPGSSATEVGARIVTGLEGGAMLELVGGAFQYVIGAGGNGGGSSGAAFSLSTHGSVERGWVGEGESGTADDQGQSQIVDVGPQPQGDQLQQTPVPFRHPLLALAQAPGSTPGDPGAAAIAVGAKGEIGRFTPGQGWRSESLYDSAGEAQTPTLRGVAWPESGRAYAVGDRGAMWVWRAETGLWEPDPATPYNFIGNLTGIAFSPEAPELGYAVGKQGVLLKYGKTWTQEPTCGPGVSEPCLPAELAGVNFTSVAFAGGEALATYRTVIEDPKKVGERVESGGIAVMESEDSGWHVDPSAATLLTHLPDIRDAVLSKVAGLPDGGAVAAGPGLVIERESSGSPWSFASQPLPEAQNVSALAAYRESGGSVRAVASIDLDPHMNPNDELRSGGAFSTDLEPPTGPGRPPAYLPPDPLPDTGYVLKQTATGWSDIEHMALEATQSRGGTTETPVRPDPVLALLVDPSGDSGLAVGGQTDDATGSPPTPNLFETAAAMRFGAGEAATGGDATGPIPLNKGVATFAAGGAAACVQPCANFAGESLAPDVLLSHALQSANQIDTILPGGLRGFLYTGDRLPETPLEAEPFERELTRYATLLGSGGALPVHAAASPKDVASGGGIAPFVKALEPFVPGGAHAYYSFPSEGAFGGKVTVIVLDFSSGTLEEPGAPSGAQEEWLKQELATAREQHTPAIVMGNASLGFSLPEQIGFNSLPVQAQDATTVAKILVEGEASAYLFDYPGANLQTRVSYGTGHIPAFGTGTLGYVSPPGPYQTDSLGSSGFLLLEVDTAEREPGMENVAHVSARVEPNIGELALDAADGVLLRRSHVGLFEALARVPPSGRDIVDEASGAVTVLGPAPYEPIPFDCLGPDCADAVQADYTFTSSNPDIGNFVAHAPSSANPREVELGPNNKPISDPHSGLFCAYNEGTTTVSITAGGLTYSEPVTVQSGSAEYPCGTVPLKNPPARTAPASAGFAIPSLSPSTPNPASPHIQSLVPPPVPVPVAPPAPAHHAHRPLPLPQVPLPPVQLFPVLALVPPPAPSVARPTPPSGTAQVPSQSPVSQQVSVAEREHQEENAVEGVHNMAVYSDSGGGPMPSWPLALVLFAVVAAVGLHPRFGSNRPVYARERSTRSRRE